VPRITPDYNVDLRCPCCSVHPVMKVHENTTVSVLFCSSCEHAWVMDLSNVPRRNQSIRPARAHRASVRTSEVRGAPPISSPCFADGALKCAPSTQRYSPRVRTKTATRGTRRRADSAEPTQESGALRHGHEKDCALHLPWCCRNLLPVRDGVLVPADESQATIL
jgi:hypothetical protein